MNGLSGLRPKPKPNLSPPSAKARETVFSDAAIKHRDSMASMKSDYGITEAEYQQIMWEQQGLCRICNKDFGEEAKRACVDHDHYTGLVRGLLCTQCNTRLGWLEKNIYRLIPYLQQR